MKIQCKGCGTPVECQSADSPELAQWLDIIVSSFLCSPCFETKMVVARLPETEEKE